MKRKSILCFLILIISCNIDKTPFYSLPFEHGEYKGTFSITYNFASDSSYVQQGTTTFTFTDTSYYCYGDKYLLPPSGGGKYEIKGNIIILTDLVPHTAEFDWSLILSGEFEYTFDGKNFMLTQNDIKYYRYRKIDLTKVN